MKQILVLIWLLVSAVAFEDDELTEPTVTVIGVLGELVNLPCDIRPNTTDDEVSLVLWYKDDSTTPIYSADARKTSLEKAHHSPAERLGNRAHLKVAPNPSVLALSSVKEEDVGLYRCRVDFKKARTRNYQVQLKVILPPNEPIITDQNGEILPTKSVIGPYNEGDKLILICQVEGGNPPPVVTWWRENFKLDDQYNVTPNGISRNELEIPALTRNDLMAAFKCYAHNNNISFPVSATVIVDLNFRPLSVWIEGEQKPLSAGKPVTLECRASGSRPPAVIEWWKAGTRMNSTSHNGTSTLTFTPVSEDSGKHLSCRAENPLISGSTIEDGWKLEVHYIPILTLRLGSKLRHQHIQEGNDVFFECDIRANPWVAEIGWRFEGKEVHTNTSAGVIVSNQSLVLQKVDLRSRGKYTCTATNSQGMGESNAVMLKVRYAPVCKKDQKTTYGAARNEAVRIICELEGDPSEISFKWRYNNTKDLMASTNVHSDGTRSWVTVVPLSEEDYGPIICWGKNNIGLQREPCVFNLIPAGPPEPVHNCTIINQTEESLTVGCLEGYDGGITQFFHMEIHDSEQRLLRGNYSSTVPVMQALHLQPATSYAVAVYSSNARGQSQPTIIIASTIPSPISLTRRGMWHLTLSPLLLLLISVVTGIILVAFIIIIIMKIRTRQVIKNSQKRAMNEDKSQHPLQMDERNMTEIAHYQDEEKCPDIIPPEPLSTCRQQERSFIAGGQPGGPLCTGTLKKGAWDVGAGGTSHGGQTSSMYQHMATLPRHDSLHLTLQSTPEWRDSDHLSLSPTGAHKSLEAARYQNYDTSTLKSFKPYTDTSMQ